VALLWFYLANYYQTLIQLLEEKLNKVMTCIIGKNVSTKQHKKLATHVTEGCLFLTFNKWKDNLLVIIYHIKQNLTVIYVCITCHRAYYSSKRSQSYNIIVPDAARIATRNMKYSKKLINGSEKRLILWNYILNAWMNPVGSFQAPSNVEVEYLPWTTETMSSFKKQKAARISRRNIPLWKCA
jgi:hypothetical protein